MNRLVNYNASLVNGTLYLVGKINASSMERILCDNITVFDSDIVINEAQAKSIVSTADGHNYEGIIVSQNEENVTIKNIDDSDIILFTTKYTSITTPELARFSLFTRIKNPIIRLEYHNKFSYEMVSNLNNNELLQTVILTSNLPYILEDVGNLRLSFQERELGNERFLMEAPKTDDIGLPIELGPIGIIIPQTKIRINLPLTKIEIIEKKFIYTMGDIYCNLRKVLKSKKGNVYPSQVTINDDDGLPISLINMPLMKEGIEFPVNYGKYPGITITTLYEEDKVKLTIKSNEDKYPFNLFIKGEELDSNYELHINAKHVTQTLNLAKKEK